MNKVKKGLANKPKLLIEIEDFQKKVEEFKQQERFNVVDVKPLRSAKNVYQMKKFNFGDDVNKISHTGRKLKKLKKLEEDKVNLMQSLEVLKESAVSAIAEKQDEITLLKMKSSFIEDQNNEAYAQTLYEQKQMRKILEDQIKQLQQQLSKERKLHVEELEEKESIIEQLCAEISQIREQVQHLEQIDIINTRKIKLLQQQNSHLSQQLQISSIATALKERSEVMVDLDETIKFVPTLSIASSVQSKKYYSYFQSSDHYFQNEVDKSYITEKIQELKKTHKEQLLDLRTFYEKRIEGLREIYIRQSYLPTESSETESVVRNRAASTGQAVKSTGSKKQLEGLQLNLKEMYAIDEIVENQLETSRSNLKNLKNQIRMQNLSECPSIQPRFVPNDDTQSQFTTKYFQIPNRFLKKNESSDSITITPDADARITTKRSFRQPQSSKNCSRKPSQVEIGINKQKTSTKKLFLFGAGFLSGIAITSMVGYKFSKRFF